ncbi:uncharacterized protein LOC110847761 [Folsomia candida]|uniref:uncharacterized protein LOC110847761 n=1 Tax=Folsomia candida TaxID=158441 RepID=UPI000B907261|nr:uncharacterized protein LOC110847761 [Folsomia candida]
MGKRCCLGLCMVGTGTEIIAVSNTILYLFTYPVCLYLLELRYKSTHRKEDENNEIISPLGTVLIILGELLMLGVSGMLLYGKIKRDPDFCKPWLYVNYFILLSYYVVLCIAFYFFSIHLDRNFYFFVLAFVFAFFIIAFKFNIVRKFIIELENETEGKDQNIAKNGTSLTQKSVGHYLPQQIFYKEATNP